jgi:hypothetical protein
MSDNENNSTVKKILPHEGEEEDEDDENTEVTDFVTIIINMGKIGWKLLKEIFMFILKFCYMAFDFLMTKIKERNKYVKDEMSSKCDNKTLFNKSLIENKLNFISRNQDNSEIKDILGIDSNIIKNNDNKNLISCNDKIHKKNKIISSKKKIKKQVDTNTDKMCEIFNLEI